MNWGFETGEGCRLGREHVAGAGAGKGWFGVYAGKRRTKANGQPTQPNFAESLNAWLASSQNTPGKSAKTAEKSVIFTCRLNIHLQV
jgi:hypothetical protein